MAYKKFDKYKDGAYWENYFKKDKEFYQIISKHLREGLAGKKTKGLDIGSGPGVGAKLADEAGLDTTIIGYEPSETYLDSVTLSENLNAKHSPTKFIPIKGGINDISGIELKSLDYILILRAIHEIIDSLGGKDNFRRCMLEIIKLLKKGGLLIIGEPQFSVEITSNPQKYADLIKEVQKYQNKMIGHCHVPGDYFTYLEFEDFSINSGLKLLKKDLLENSLLLRYLNEAGLSLNKSPALFYIETYKKEDTKDKINNINFKNSLEEEDLEKIKSGNFSKIVKRDNSLFWESILRFGAIQDNEDFEFSNPIKNFLLLENTAYSPLDEVKKLKEVMVLKIKQDEGYLARLFNRLRERCIDLENFSSINRGLNFEGMSNEELTELFNGFVDHCLKILSYLWITIAPEDFLINELNIELAKRIDTKVNFDLFEKSLYILQASEKDSNLRLRQIEILKHIARGLHNCDIDQIYSRFSWIEDHGLKLIKTSKKELIDEVNSISQSQASLRLDQINNEKEKLLIDKKRIIDQFKFDERIVNYLNIISELPEVRFLRTEKIVEEVHIMKKMFDNISKRLKINCMDLTFWEIIEGLRNNKTFEDKIILKENSYYFSPNEIIKIQSQDVSLIDKIVNQDEDISKNKIIKGNIACRGIAKGIVKIFNSAREKLDFKQGDILVTSMTTPDFVPLMKKAGAIVTDEGGISCHAAIVSRELNVPCIIATKNATKILKTGDYVDVDANKGIVKILS